MRATNQIPAIRRRAFIRTTAGGAAGVVLGACKTETNTVTRVTLLTQPPTSVADTAPTLPVDTTAPTTTDDASNTIVTVWRLSTRNQRSPCGACKAHAAHRFFSSAEAAEAGRAHAGCSCEVREQRTTFAQFQDWFAEGDQIFDDRRT